MIPLKTMRKKSFRNPPISGTKWKIKTREGWTPSASGFPLMSNPGTASWVPWFCLCPWAPPTVPETELLSLFLPEGDSPPSLRRESLHSDLTHVVPQALPDSCGLSGSAFPQTLSIRKSKVSWLFPPHGFLLGGQLWWQATAGAFPPGADSWTVIVYS